VSVQLLALVTILNDAMTLTNAVLPLVNQIANGGEVTDEQVQQAKSALGTNIRAFEAALDGDA
jgi:hypothetical protein